VIVTVVAPKEAMDAMAPLVTAYRDKGYAVRHLATDGSVPDQKNLREIAGDSQALLVIGSSRRAPKTVLPGPVIATDDGRGVPAGWLPLVSIKHVARFAETAARVHRRQGDAQPVAVLSQWQSQYLRLAERVETLLTQQQQPVFRWSSDLLLREDMVQGLRSGLAAAIYVGHGRPVGWVGYRGTRAHHFEEDGGEPLGVLFSLCCRTASRRRTGLSFAEALPLLGVAGATIGSVTDTLHKNNARWAVGICAAMASGASTLGELMLKAFPVGAQAVQDYRILGDPLIPLRGAADSIAAANAIQLHP